ncbi:hypothetical protein ACNS7O_03120 [Haloferacaceae archaeon DSL9]
MSVDSSVVSIEPVETLSAETSVRHYDELDERTQASLWRLVSEPADEVTTADIRLDPGDVVVFTEYFEIRLT